MFGEWWADSDPIESAKELINKLLLALVIAVVIIAIIIIGVGVILWKRKR
jgi:hypothetical protein